jgi:hypothetical protein
MPPIDDRRHQPAKDPATVPYVNTRKKGLDPNPGADLMLGEAPDIPKQRAKVGAAERQHRPE